MAEKLTKQHLLFFKKATDDLSVAKGLYASPKETIAHPNKERVGKSKIRTLGAYKGRIKMSNDFDQPLPESYWTGKSNTFCHS
ncbi:MAG: hypothetical protein WCR55_09095 [Lentisphaerota bacterium]